MFKTLVTRGLRPAASKNTVAIDEALRHLLEALDCARKADEKRSMEAIFAAIRTVKGSRQHLYRRLHAFGSAVASK
jgi:hypothetical protein